MGMGLVTDGFQDGGAALVVGDAAIELFQVISLRERNVQLFDFKGAGVANYITLGHGLAVIATKAKVQTGGRRKFVHFEAGGESGFNGVMIVAGTGKLDSVFCEVPSSRASQWFQRLRRAGEGGGDCRQTCQSPGRQRTKCS